MPRVSRAQAERNRAAIEQASARLFRERGLAGASVVDLMAAAGLTHGGFYGHFQSKDELAAAACAAAFEQSRERWRRRMAGQPDARAARRALVQGYLSARNRDDAGTGCPAAGLSGDVAREPAGKPVRAAFADGIRRQVDTLAGLQDAASPGDARRRALAQYAAMVGALVLARATRGEPISDEFLAAARDSLLGGAAATPTPPEAAPAGRAAQRARRGRAA